jgi:hypothetical protein
MSITAKFDADLDSLEKSAKSYSKKVKGRKLLHIVIKVKKIHYSATF